MSFARSGDTVMVHSMDSLARNLDDLRRIVQTLTQRVVLLDRFIASHTQAPRELILDIDATHVPLHGAQEKAHFHSYYDNYCSLPLYVFCGQDLLACVLRSASRDPASVLSALIKLLVRRLRQAWCKRMPPY